MKKKRVKHLDSEEEFRVRVLSALKVNKSNLYLYVDDEVHDEEEFHNMSWEEIGNALKSTSGDYRNSFARLLRSVSEERNGRKRLWDVFQRYHPQLSEDDKFVLALETRFFKCVWPDNPRYNHSRREDEEYIMEVSKGERLSHVTILKELLPVEIAMLILKFLPYDYHLICTLGIVSAQWYQLILESWPHLTFSKKNFIKIPLNVLKKVRIIRFSDVFSANEETLDPTPFDYIFEHITPNRITEIDFGMWYSESDNFDSFWKYPLKIEFPNCRSLKCGNDPCFWKLCKYFSFPRLVSVDCYFLDLLPSRGWDVIDFQKVRTLQMVMKNSIFSDTWWRNSTRPRFEESFKKVCYDECVTKLYSLVNLDKIVFDFGTSTPNGFLHIKEKSDREENEVGGLMYIRRFREKYEYKKVIVDLRKMKSQIKNLEILSYGSSDRPYFFFSDEDIDDQVERSNPLNYFKFIEGDPTTPSFQSASTIDQNKQAKRSSILWKTNSENFRGDECKEGKKFLSLENHFKTVRILFHVQKPRYSNYNTNSLQISLEHIFRERKKGNYHGLVQASVEFEVVCDNIGYSSRSRRKSAYRKTQVTEPTTSKKIRIDINFEKNSVTRKEGKKKKDRKVVVKVEGRLFDHQKHRLSKRSNGMLESIEESIRSAWYPGKVEESDDRFGFGFGFGFRRRRLPSGMLGPELRLKEKVFE